MLKLQAQAGPRCAQRKAWCTGDLARGPAVQRKAADPEMYHDSQPTPQRCSVQAVMMSFVEAPELESECQAGPCACLHSLGVALVACLVSSRPHLRSTRLQAAA